MRIGLGVGIDSARVATYARLPSGVPAVSYQKAGAAFMLEVLPGDAWEARINGQLYASGVGSGLVSGLLTRAMVANPATFTVTTSRGASVSATGLVYGPDLLGALLNSWHDETGSYTGGTWAATAGGASKDLQTVTASPTTGTRNGRRTIVTNGSTQYLTRAFTRNQPSETWFAGRWTGIVGSNKTLVSGFASSGQIYRNSIATQLSLYAGATANFATTSVTDRWLIAGALFNGAASSLMDTGTALGTANAGTTAPAGLTIGQSGSGSNFAAGEIGEVITSTGALDAFNLLHLPAYLAAAWAI